MTPLDILTFKCDESERMLQWAFDQAQMMFYNHGDPARLARDIRNAEEAHRLNLAVAEVEFEIRSWE